MTATTTTFLIPASALAAFAVPSGEDLEWQQRALCAQTDPDAFFPEKGGSTREPRTVCNSCEVRTECLDYALQHDERFGVWGGTGERERRHLKLARADSHTPSHAVTTDAPAAETAATEQEPAVSTLTRLPTADIARASCADDPERMFPIQESATAGDEPTPGEARALAVCASCPVLRSCRAAVLGDTPMPTGVFGGMTAAARRAYRAEHKQHQPQPAPELDDEPGGEAGPTRDGSGRTPAPVATPTPPPADPRPVRIAGTKTAGTLPRRPSRGTHRVHAAIDRTRGPRSTWPHRPSPTTTVDSPAAATSATTRTTPAPITPALRTLATPAAVAARPGSRPVTAEPPPDPLLAAVLESQHGQPGAESIDQAVVAALVAGETVEAANRWTVAAAAGVAVLGNVPRAQVARTLGEPAGQVGRWVTRHQKRTALVAPLADGRAAGTSPLTRPTGHDGGAS